MQSIYEIVSNRPLALNTWEVKLGYVGPATPYADAGPWRLTPGQFVNVAIPGFFLRRPLSVCAQTDRELTLIYKTVGQGTRALSSFKPGTRLDLLVGLGNGFSLAVIEDPARATRPLLVGGGVGVPPLYELAKRLRAAGKRPVVLLGFGSGEEVFYEAEFAALGCEVIVSTIDGSYGHEGLVTDLLGEIDFDYVYSCGPLGMLRALYEATSCAGEYSFEERMGCGFGACMGCPHRVEASGGEKRGSLEEISTPVARPISYKRICKEGPVLERSEIVW